MATLNLGRLAFDELGASGLARPAAEKFAGAWVACLLVMARGNIFAAFSFEHLVLATVCGTVGAVVTVALLVQMDRTTNSVSRQATLSAVVTLFATSSHVRLTLGLNGASRWSQQQYRLVLLLPYGT